MGINTVTVVGAGAMGAGIAQVSAFAGYDVILNDISQAALEKGLAGIVKNLNRMAEKGKITEDQAKAAAAKISTTTDLAEACKGADLLVECVFENLALKQKMFVEFEKFCKADAVLATNTSALPITEIATVTKCGERIIGIHFMNPVPLMKGVEVIRGQLTSDAVMDAALEYVRKIDKEPIIAIDFAGFIVSRMVDVLMNEAVKLVEEGNAPEEIDKAMKLCCGHSMGPCTLLDLVGWEIAMHGMETMARDFGDRYLPHKLLKKRVLAGLLGQKAGKGFYDYSK